MCNLYSMNRTRDEIRGLIGALRDLTGNQPPLPGIYPDYQAPIVRMENGERIIANARWGLPSPVFALQGKRTDRGITNVRNTSSPHWRRWLGPANRCLVPLTSFSEPELPSSGTKGNAWFALDETEPLAFFAGIWVPQWKSVRKVKDGETVDDLYAFLTTEPNGEVAPIHPKAMPAILTKPEEWEAWLSAEWAEAKVLQRPLADGTLAVVKRGVLREKPA
jgi:putative SOS response-associated peptidase YedK